MRLPGAGPGVICVTLIEHEERRRKRSVRARGLTREVAMADHRFIFGDALEALRRMEAESIDCGFTETRESGIVGVYGERREAEQCTLTHNRIAPTGQRLPAFPRDGDIGL
jgi:hypothetical protein